MNKSYSRCKDTEHLEDRVKTRVGIPKRAIERYVRLIRKKGMTIEEVKESGNIHLYRYLLGKQRSDYEIRVYDKYILITTHDGVGVTILNIPKDLIKRR